MDIFYEIPMPFILIGIFLVVMIAISLISGSMAKAKEAKHLTLDVKLVSQKAWRIFDPDDAFSGMTRRQVAEAKRLFDPGSRRDRLRIRWSYTTPSGRDFYSDESVYPADQMLLEKLNRAESILNGGNEKVDMLNRMYAEALRDGREIEDGTPKIYGYRILGSRKHEDLIKVGYASKNAHQRIAQQFQTAARLEVDHEILFILPALTVTDEHFTDRAVHRVLRNRGILNPEGEWFECDTEVAEDAVRAVQQNSQ